MSKKQDVFQEQKARYLEAILQGDRTEASAVIDDALFANWNPQTIMLEILMPTQEALGEMWHERKINVANEHLATEITLHQMARLRQHIRPRAKLSHRVALTTLPSERHALGLQMVADFFYEDGWQIEYLGAETPLVDLLSFLESEPIDLLVFSMTLENVLPMLYEFVEVIRKVQPRIKLLLGGYLVKQRPDLFQEEVVGVDLVHVDPLEAIQAARQLFQLHDGSTSLQQYLKELGEYVQTLRKARRWSQSQLAKAAGLDRTYISSLEHGKQNLTLGAVMKIADALEVSIQYLLNGPPNLD